MKKVMILLAMASLGVTAMAQTESQKKLPVLNDKQSEYIPVLQYWKEHDILQHMDVSLTAGTTGLGLELSSPIGEYVQLRAGYDFTPHFTKNMQFDVIVGDEPARRYDANGNRVETRFDRMSEMLYSFSGFDADDHIDMAGKPTMSNFKLLVDVFPFKANDNWSKNIHFTAGFYWGASKFAEAVNTTEAMVTLLSIGMYNRMYDNVMNGDPVITLPNPQNPSEPYESYLNPHQEKMFRDAGRMGFKLGEFAHDIYDSYGELVHREGDPYVMVPNSKGMVVVKAKSNAFKPYLGFGYGGRLVKNRDDWKVSFDAGVWFWGGSPDLYMHDGINLTKDVRNISGQVGDYVDLAKTFKVYPVLNVKFTKRIF
ncbi:hypothetical protein [Prevotella sp. khp7]|uniref:hypothetical protein n=1 Tax=Prevotella sp. khp7 TaxID=1761885 RepID=UPI00115F82CF|nr:hypothetical protein [Prevotella sp. khp7]